MRRGKRLFDFRIKKEELSSKNNRKQEDSLSESLQFNEKKIKILPSGVTNQNSRAIPEVMSSELTYEAFLNQNDPDSLAANAPSSKREEKDEDKLAPQQTSLKLVSLKERASNNRLSQISSFDYTTLEEGNPYIPPEVKYELLGKDIIEKIVAQDEDVDVLKAYAFESLNNNLEAFFDTVEGTDESEEYKTAILEIGNKITDYSPKLFYQSP